MIKECSYDTTRNPTRFTILDKFACLVIARKIFNDYFKVVHCSSEGVACERAGAVPLGAHYNAVVASHSYWFANTCKKNTVCFIIARCRWVGLRRRRCSSWSCLWCCTFRRSWSGRRAPIATPGRCACCARTSCAEALCQRETHPSRRWRRWSDGCHRARRSWREDHFFLWPA